MAAILFALACVLTFLHALLMRPVFGRVHLGWLGVAVYMLFFAIMAVAHPPG